jgi:hypothetical protein
MPPEDTPGGDAKKVGSRGWVAWDGQQTEKLFIFSTIGSIGGVCCRIPE